MKTASFVRIVGAVVVTSAALVDHAMAVNVNWTAGGSDTNWNTAANWSSNPALPGTSDQARLMSNSSATAAIVDSVVGDVNQLRVGNGSGGYLNIVNGGGLTTLSTSEADSARIGDGTTGKLVQTGGSLYIGGGLMVGQGSSGNGTYEISGGTLSTNYMFLGRGSSGAVGVVNQTGGAVTLRDGGDALRIGATTGATGTYNISGGSITSNRIIIGAEGNATTTGTMVVSDAAQVSAGNAFRLGADGTGVLVLDGSRSGVGTDVLITGDRFTWTKDAEGGPAKPGGTLRALIDDDAILTPSLMRTVATKAITINVGSLLDPGFAPGTTPTAGTWTVLTWTGSDPTNNLSLAPGVASGWTYLLDTANNRLTVTYAVPEPASLGALSLAGTLLVRRRRGA